MASGNVNDDGEGEEKSLIALALSLGFSVAVPLAVFVVGGVGLDSLLKTSPLFVLLGIFLGLFSASYSFWRLIVLSEAKNNRSKK